MTLDDDLTNLNERRVAELERKVDLLEKTLKICAEWMIGINEINDIDDRLMHRLDERITELEDHALQLK